MNVTRQSARIRAVLFDLDGLLSDTERVFFAAYQAVASRYGETLTLEDYVANDLHRGVPSRAARAIVARGTSLPDFQKELYAQYGKQLVGRVRPMPGALECVARLRTRYPLGMVSSSRGQYLDYILAELGISHLFRAVVCREDVVHSKPDPEGLKKVLAVLGLAPHQCVFIEDAERGMNAAHAIGMRCVVVPNRLLKDRATYEGAVLIKSLDELTPDFINTVLSLR